MSNSKLVSVTVLSPNNSGTRTMKIDRITPHCVVGQMSAGSLGTWFSHSSTQASSNYGIGWDGKIGMYVPEDKRSWCSSSAANDQRAVTIECASDTTAKTGYAMRDAVYASLIKLCVDICQRNGKTKLLWIPDKAKALAYSPKKDEMLLTVHRWFANKSCPGEWLYSRLTDLANKVTKELTPKEDPTPTPAPSTGSKAIEAGATIELKNEPLYASSTNKTVANRVTGKYYYWGGPVVNGRIRITNAKSRVGISGQVTGWIDKPSDVGYIVYVVQSGDTLRKIATRYSSTIAKIGEINNLTNLDLIRVGQKLKIPV